jgi:hypothetical protein
MVSSICKKPFVHSYPGCCENCIWPASMHGPVGDGSRYVVEFLIVSGGEFFENTLGVVPVEHANRWEVQQGVVRSEG